jgi:c-di-GMP-binding flagellar brake protein YcgR
MAAPEGKTVQERRNFFRINFKSPVQFKTYSADGEKSAHKPAASHGTSQNVSPTGILFQTETKPPALSSIILMNMDIRTLHICQEIEKRAITFNNGLLGKVVRVEEDPEDGAYDVGVCFLTQSERNSRQVQKLLAEISKGEGK